jgi:hypothetical protein
MKGKATMDLRAKQDQLMEIEIKIGHELLNSRDHDPNYKKACDLYPQAIAIMREILNEVIRRKGSKEAST